MMLLFRAFFGPNLYRIRGPEGQCMNYTPNRLERWTGYTLLASKCIWFLIKLTSPISLIIVWRRGGFALDDNGNQHLMGFVRIVAFFVSVYGAAYVLRGVGRYFNKEYVSFMRNLDHYRRHRTPENCEKLFKFYDCDFSALPVEFTNTAPLKSKLIAPNLNIFWKIFALGLLKTIGRRLLYPGSLQLFNAALHSMLIQSRSKLIEDKGAKRTKIQTTDGNFIDTLFVDNRLSDNPLGRILVICCEGNAGYYEIGIMATPLQLGYSVLGWNHPGFGCSTGEPLPSQELHAVDAVMHFAEEYLKFPESNILLFAWSIGGFPASFIASHYPNISGLILDATFDDILPLALARMPKTLATPVTHVVRHYLNLNIAEQLCRYDGPILLIRRTLDEVLTINHENEEMSGNRGDYLLKRLLSHRYPKLVNQDTLPLLNEWLKAPRRQQDAIYTDHSGTTENDLTTKLEDFLEELSLTDSRDIRFPLNVGHDLDLSTKQHLTLYVAKLHIIDFEDTHCTPLPVALFRNPWHPKLRST